MSDLYEDEEIESFIISSDLAKIKDSVSYFTDGLLSEKALSKVTKSSYQLYCEICAKKKTKSKNKTKKDKKKKHKKKNDNDSVEFPLIDPITLVNDFIFSNGNSIDEMEDFVPEEMELNFISDPGVFFGMKKYLGKGHYVGKPQGMDGHILYVGGPGSGKTFAGMIPTIMTWKGIAIIIDIKGDLEKYWYMLNRHTGKRLKVFNPTKEWTCCYDPFSILRYDKSNIVQNVRELAISLLPISPEVKEPIWIICAQNFLTAVMIYNFELEFTFIETMEMLLSKSIEESLTEILESDNGKAKAYINTLKGASDRTLAGIGLEVVRLAVFATDPQVKYAFDAKVASDFIEWIDLNIKPEAYDVILQIPENKLEQWEAMTMLIINQLIKTLECRADKNSADGKDLPPVLIMLDEFPRLGKIPAIKNGLTTLRSRGVTIELFIQSLSQLDEIYGKAAREIIVDTCQFKVILNVTDAENQKYFSDLVGTVVRKQKGISINYEPYTREACGASISINESREPVILPHEFATLKDIILLTPYGFYRVNKIPFYCNKNIFLPRLQLLEGPILSYQYNI